MKAMIYAGIALFSVATVYGVADYIHSKKSGVLTKLYSEEEDVESKPVAKSIEKSGTIKEVAAVSTVVESKTSTTKKKKTVKAPQVFVRVDLDNFSRGRIIERPRPVVEEKTAPELITAPEPEKISVVPIEEKKVEVAPAKEKEFVFEPSRFSRASLKRPVKKLKTE